MNPRIQHACIPLSTHPRARGTGGARGDLSREASELSDKASSIVSSETSERRMLRGGGAPVERRVRVACYSEQLAADLASIGNAQKADGEPCAVT